MRKLYVGPRGLAAEDLVDLLSVIVAATFTSAIKKEEQEAAREELLEFINSRIRGVVRDAPNNEGNGPSKEQQEK